MLRSASKYKVYSYCIVKNEFCQIIDIYNLAVPLCHQVANNQMRIT